MTALLTDNLPLMTGAPNGIKKLRELILELAVRGKLVPQEPNDEPASELLKLIAEEKTRLLAEGKIRKQKPFADISDAEKLFELPCGWEWVRLGTIQTFTNGYAFKSHDFQETGVGVIRIGDVKREGFISTNEMVRFPEEKIFEIDNRYFVEPGDLVITMTGDVKLAFNRSDERFLLNQRVGKITIHQASEKYVCILLTTQAQEKIEQASGSVISNVSTEEINNSVISLPPLAEQHRIVAKVEELMALCDRLEVQQADAESAHAQLVKALLDSLSKACNSEDYAQNWQRLAEHFHILFTTESSIDALKQNLLQLAVMGKLVPQDPSDESARELLEQIAKEKALWMAEGKIRKQKPLAEVLDDEKLFELPAGWIWTRLGDICFTQTGTTPTKSQPELFGSDVPFIKPGDIHPDQVDYSGEGLSSLGVSQSGRIAKSGSLLMVCIGTIGKCNLIDRDCSFNQQINSATLYKGLPKYLLIAARSAYFQGKAWGDSSSTTIAILNKGKWEAIPLPLPGLAEQYRIVTKVDELMALCDQLKSRLTQARQLNEQLASTLVEQAVI